MPKRKGVKDCLKQLLNSKFKEENESADAGGFMSSLPLGLKGLAAEILYKEYTGDAQKTVKEIIEKIKKLNFDQKINTLAKEGRIDEINELIKATRKGNLQ